VQNDQVIVAETMEQVDNASSISDIASMVDEEPIGGKGLQNVETSSKHVSEPQNDPMQRLPAKIHHSLLQEIQDACNNH
jgi:hypothetical protein